MRHWDRPSHITARRDSGKIAESKHNLHHTPKLNVRNFLGATVGDFRNTDLALEALAIRKKHYKHLPVETGWEIPAAVNARNA